MLCRHLFRRYSVEKKVTGGKNSDKLNRWDDEDQYQLCQEDLTWFGCRDSEIDELCFKTEQIMLQRGINLHGQKGNDSAMKKIKKLVVKNECYGEIT